MLACPMTPFTSFQRYRWTKLRRPWLAWRSPFEIEGATNDYTGKGLSGGRIVVYPTQMPGRAEDNIVVGNTVMIGATEGESFFRGIAANASAYATRAPPPW